MILLRLLLLAMSLTQTLVADTLTYTGTIAADVFQVQMPQLTVVVVARKYISFVSAQQGFVYSLLAEPFFSGADSASYWQATYSSPNPFVILSSDMSISGAVITMEVQDSSGCTFWQTILTTASTCYLLTTYSVDGTSHQSDHEAFATTFSLVH